MEFDLEDARARIRKRIDRFAAENLVVSVFQANLSDVLKWAWNRGKSIGRCEPKNLCLGNPSQMVVILSKLPFRNLKENEY
jgi:hypothetical protein